MLLGATWAAGRLEWPGLPARKYMLHTKSIFDCYLRLVKCNTKIGQKKRKSIKGRVRKNCCIPIQAANGKMMLFWGVRCFKRMVVLKAWNACAMFVSHEGTNSQAAWEPTRLSKAKVWQHNLWSWKEKYTVDSIGQLPSRSHNFHLSFKIPLKPNTSSNASQEFLPSYAFLLHPLSHLQGLLPVGWRGQATQKSIVTLKAENIRSPFCAV